MPGEVHLFWVVRQKGKLSNHSALRKCCKVPREGYRPTLFIWRRGLDAHARVLLSLAASTDEDVYVWWGRIRSPNRLQPLPHMDQLRTIAAEIAADPDVERHLYLTDYRSLYVGSIEAIAFDDPQDPTHTPPYYKKNNFQCDLWFKLGDVRRVVDADLRGVIAALEPLRNVNYHDRPVPLYGGIVDLPLVVKRADDRSWFTDEEYDLIGGKHFFEFDHDTAGTGAMVAHLRDDVLGERCWNALQPLSKSFLAMAELEWRARRDEPGADYSGIMMSFAKAVENETRAVLRSVLTHVDRLARTVNHEGRSLDLLQQFPNSLGAIAHAINNNEGLFEALRKTSPNGQWLVSQWAPALGELAILRNPAAHGGAVKRADVHRWRNRLLGVGGQSDLVELGRARGV